MFDENTNFENNRYEVKFPFKENAEILGTISKVAKND